MMSEDKPISETPTTGDESDASAGKRTHSEDSDDDGVPLKQARMETAQDGVTDTEHQESDNSTHETSDLDAETTGPSENTEKVADDTGTSENAETVADDTGTSENAATVADDTDSSENTATVADDSVPSENTATVADDSVPSENMATVTDDTDPSENTATVADDSVPSENTATVADDSVPSENTATVADDLVPSENTATVADDTGPSENTVTVADDSKNVVENDSNITVSKPADATECEQTESDEKKRVEKKDTSPPSSEISESTDGVYDLSVKSVNKATAVKADKPDKGKALLPEMEENKENIQTGLNSYNGPIDLSTSKSSPDVIMLSDEDDDSAPLMNGHVNGNILELCAEKLLERQKLIRRLQEELRNEEAKLVLLKKIRQSQASLQVTEPEKSSQSTGHNSNKLHSSSSSSSAQRNGSAGNVPPPLVRGGQTPAHTKSNNLTSQLLRTQQQQHHHQTHHRGGGGSSQNQGPPPLVMAPRSNTQSHLQHNSRGSHHPVTTAPNHTSGFRQVPQQTPQPPAQPEQTPAQRQAAAKLALRKQLEKTLLQIPPPKPPPPEMNFIPSLSSSDFILLVGLEETVKYITDTDKPKEKSTEVKYVFNPFTCVQCGTDFTPVWKRDKVGSRNVICEQCVTTNQKKALKQEHTNRLKSAFVKALQQEQEIEQRMQSQTNAAAAAAAAAAQAASSSSSSSNSRETTTSSHGGSSNNAGAPMNLSTNFKPSREQIQQHHNLIQAHQAHQAAQLRHQQLAGLQAFNQRLAFPFPLGNFQTGKPSDLHRQYLLDMIPPRSMPGGTVLWKS